MKHLLLTTIAGVLLCQTVFAEVADLEKIYLPPHTFSLPKGFTLKPVAAPPLVQRPIHMYFDEGGALYVTDSSGDSQKAPRPGQACATYDEECLRSVCHVTLILVGLVCRNDHEHVTLFG